jgi:hypothetical protein
VKLRIKHVQEQDLKVTPFLPQDKSGNIRIQLIFQRLDEPVNYIKVCSNISCTGRMRVNVDDNNVCCFFGCCVSI